MTRFTLIKKNVHKRTGEIMFTYFLQSNLHIKKLQANIDKLKGHLEIEQSDSKSWLRNINNLQQKLVEVVKDKSDTQILQKLIKEKDDEIQIFKKKFNIPKTPHIQSIELLALKEEKG